MKIIIDIPEEMIEAAKTDLWCSSPTLGYAIKKSIPYKERPHGEWVINPNGLRIGKVTHYAVVCSLCKWSTLFADNFCPNCGASMAKEGEAE